MNVERFIQMVDLRRSGLTYQEIGDRLGVSRQYVHETIGKRFKGDLNNIKRVNLREYFRKTLMSIPAFTGAVFGDKNGWGRAEKQRVINFLEGKSAHFRIEDFIRMSEQTGLSLKELAELDKGAE